MSERSETIAKCMRLRLKTVKTVVNTVKTTNKQGSKTTEHKYLLDIFVLDDTKVI